MEGSLQLLKQAGKVMAAVEKWSIYIVYTFKKHSNNNGWKCFNWGKKRNQNQKPTNLQV